MRDIIPRRNFGDLRSALLFNGKDSGMGIASYTVGFQYLWEGRFSILMDHECSGTIGSSKFYQGVAATVWRGTANSIIEKWRQQLWPACSIFFLNRSQFGCIRFFLSRLVAKIFLKQQCRHTVATLCLLPTTVHTRELRVDSAWLLWHGVHQKLWQGVHQNNVL